MDADTSAADVVAEVSAAAVRDHGWSKDQIEVGSTQALDLGGCRFYRVSNRARAGQQPADYAVLPDGSLVSGTQAGGASGAEAVLRSCGQNAPAEWWAQVVSRFAPVGGVMVDENAPSAIRRIRKSGASSYAPTLRPDGNAKVLTFYSNDYERSTTYRVTATLDAAGKLSVDKAALVSAQTQPAH
ncbi:hypothetical protein [Lysobacter antibioticus]|uniref:Uncharacterized protein n=1 Tax=Lysobacter antibioticus TaxID=84531 RepID=A0A0S2F8D4_LYSAN|nr:hypothetical protein [Lysobacter antibioticus]ALN79813.1 hypothetical protein LA76x_1657 [Lysobacter antibioticus]